MKWLITFALGTLSAFALSQDPAPISTDRPDFTESAKVVPLRSVQLETGFTYQWTKGSYNFSGPEALFRLGNRPNSEIRIGIPDYNRSRSTGKWVQGFGDVYLATKIQLTSSNAKDDFAIIPGINLPTRSAHFSSRTLDPEIKFCWGRDLGQNWGVSAMAYALYTTDDSGRLLQFQQTISFDRELTPNLGIFIEYAGGFSARSQPDHVVHLGVLLATSPTTQFDIHGGWSLYGSDRRPFVAAGYSVRR